MDEVYARNQKVGFLSARVNYASRFQKRHALLRCHNLPALVGKKSPLGRRDRHIAYFEDESGQRGISKPFVVINSELAELVVACDKLPTISGSIDDQRTHLHVGDDGAVQPELKIRDHRFLRFAAQLALEAGG